MAAPASPSASSSSAPGEDHGANGHHAEIIGKRPGAGAGWEGKNGSPGNSTCPSNFATTDFNLPHETSVQYTATCYAEFVQLCRRRTEELKIPYSTLDSVCGWADGYCSTLMCGTKRMSVDTLFAFAAALGLVPVFVPSSDLLKKLQSRSDWVETIRPGPKWRKPWARQAQWQAR